MAKIKLKTKSSAKKRFSKTGSGKIKRGRANHRHILEHKNAKRGRRLRTSTLVSAADERSVKRMLAC